MTTAIEALHPLARRNLHWRLVDVVKSNLKPPPHLNLVEWADQKRYLPDNSAEAGRWHTDRVEAAREPMLAITDPKAQEVTVMSCVQLMKTELMLNAALYYIDQEPSPIMYVAPKSALAEAWSKERFMKSVLATPATRETFSHNRRGDGNTILQKQFPGGQISIVSAQNPDDLAMRAVRIMLFDEVDKYPVDVAGEGDPIAVAWGRATTFGRRAKKICACSPTTEGRSRIHQEYLKSDQREYHQECPHCGHKMVVDWYKHVVIPEDAKGNLLPDDAHIVCEACETPWSEGDRAYSIRHGEWIPGHPEVTHHRGYKVSAMASPFISIVKLAREYVDAKDNPLSMKTFTNTRLADVYREKGEAPDWQRLYERRETYPIRKVPLGGLMLTCGIDVQKDYLIYEVVAYGRKKISWSIDTGVIDGHISLDETKEQLSRFIEQRYVNQHGIEMPMEMILIDSSNDTQEVYNACAQVGSRRLRPIKGVGSLTTIIGNPKPVQIDINGVRKDGGVKMWPLGVNVLKEQFYKWLLLARPTDEALADGAEWPTGYCHFPEWGEDYFKQITAEILIEKADKHGYLVQEWERIRDHNHLLDCRNYARAGASMLGIDRMIDTDWDARERRYGVSDTSITEAGKTDTTPTTQNTQKPKPAPKRKKRPAKFFGRRGQR